METVASDAQVLAREIAPPPDGWYRVNGKLLPGVAEAEKAVRVLLSFIGEDVIRSGLADTPARVVRAWAEMTTGYKEDPAAILSRVFEEPTDEIVIARKIPFTSLCEHHLLPFVGTVDVGYLPSTNGKIVGLSKLPRLVDCFARRLQVQERMTRQVATSIMEHLQAQGAAVVVRAVHSCLACRGAKKPGAEMVTSVMLGVFREKQEARAEFLELCRD